MAARLVHPDAAETGLDLQARGAARSVALDADPSDGRRVAGRQLPDENFAGHRGAVRQDAVRLAAMSDEEARRASGRWAERLQGVAELVPLDAVHPVQPEPRPPDDLRFVRGLREQMVFGLARAALQLATPELAERPDARLLAERQWALLQQARRAEAQLVKLERRAWRPLARPELRALEQRQPARPRDACGLLWRQLLLRPYPRRLLLPLRPRRPLRPESACELFPQLGDRASSSASFFP